MKIIYKYSISLDLFKGEGTYELREHKIEIDSETDKTIMFFDGRARKLKKESLNAVSIKFDEKSYDFISYYIYCLEDDIEAAKSKLVSKIAESLEKRSQALDKLIAAHKAGYQIKEMKQILD